MNEVVKFLSENPNVFLCNSGGEPAESQTVPVYVRRDGKNLFLHKQPKKRYTNSWKRIQT